MAVFMRDFIFIVIAPLFCLYFLFPCYLSPKHLTKYLDALDNVPYKENGHLKDNLDLSVKRATTVTRLLLQNKGIAPERIVSAGRGDALPLDSENSREARQKNRRTEIILTPKLDELFQLAQ